MAGCAGAASRSLLECSHGPESGARTNGVHRRTRARQARTKFDRSCAGTASSEKHCTFFVQKRGSNMKQPSDFFHDFQDRMSELLKNSPAKDLERNMKALLSQGFSKLDLVTREEFDTQTQVLLRTRTRLEELERRVAELEQRLSAVQEP
jgi:ubiquinone biosynthesis accessory factor UbiK